MFLKKDINLYCDESPNRVRKTPHTSESQLPKRWHTNTRTTNNAFHIHFILGKNNL